MDSPDLIVACIVGDGEAESGPTATAWHAAKYIDPAESGAVIPIVHVNGFKISERTIYGCMDDKEMVSLFTGYGYQCRFVEDLEDIVSLPFLQPGGSNPYSQNLLNASLSFSTFKSECVTLFHKFKA